jgi:hypothetical protein
MFGKILAVAACALVTVSQAAKLQFTTIPGPATIGVPTQIKWVGGSGNEVTLILRKGDPSDLSTIGIIASKSRLI